MPDGTTDARAVTSDGRCKSLALTSNAHGMFVAETAPCFSLELVRGTRGAAHLIDGVGELARRATSARAVRCGSRRGALVFTSDARSELAAGSAPRLCLKLVAGTRSTACLVACAAKCTLSLDLCCLCEGSRQGACAVFRPGTHFDM